jgi:hypothetical protein
VNENSLVCTTADPQLPCGGGMPALFERLENRVQLELLGDRAPPKLHEPDNFITFVSSLLVRESISNRRLANEVNGLSFLCPRWKSLKQGRQMAPHTITAVPSESAPILKCSPKGEIVVALIVSNGVEGLSPDVGYLQKSAKE